MGGWLHRSKRSERNERGAQMKNEGMGRRCGRIEGRCRDGRVVVGVSWLMDEQGWLMGDDVMGGWTPDVGWVGTLDRG